MAKHADASHEEVSKADTAEETSSAATELGADDVEDYDDAVDADADDDPKDVAAEARPMSPVRLATVLGVVAVVASTALAGWLGFRQYQAHQAQQQSELLIQVGRQGALNLTTIDWQHADADIQRILDSATGTFYDDFSKRSKPFVDVVKKAQSKSVGTVTEAGLESRSGDEAQVLVAVSVSTTNLGAAEEEPRHWRMRMSVKKVGDEAKVSNVAFVQ
jgi:Mce-associated membrane protein